MSSGEYRPRLSIELTEKQHSDLQRLIPWGVKNQLFSTIVDQLIPLLEEHGTHIISLILENKLKASHLLGLPKGGYSDGEHY